MMKGRRRLDVKDVMAKIRRANVPTRVAPSQASSTSLGVRLGFAAKIGLT